MTDLPTQGMLQQMNARPVSGEHLEVLGKRASAMFLEGRENSLNDAVVGVVKEAGLSTEQVLRVIEFANTDAFLVEFRKEGSGNRVVNFDGGPASPSVVLKDLNDGGGGSVYDRGDSDYHQPPESKHASVNLRAERELWEKLAGEGRGELPEANPYGDVIRLRDELTDKHAHALSMISDLEVRFEDVSNSLLQQVKQAALSGVPLSDIVTVWALAAPDPEYVKLAFSQLQKPLIDNGVFPSDRHFIESLEKNASARRVNPEHPLSRDFADYCDILSKLAELRDAEDVLAEASGQLTSFLKQADNKKGLIQHGFEKAKELAGHGAHHAGKATRALLGEAEGSVGAKAAPHVESAVKHLPHAAVALAGLEAAKRVAYDPTSQRIQHVIWRNNPMSSAWQQQVQGLQMGVGDPYGQNYGGY